MVEAEAELKRLMLAGLAGDAAAHRALLAAVARSLRAYYRARLRGAPEDAEDLVQETLIAIHTRRDSYDPAYPVTAWIYAIARYRMIDHWRRGQRRGGDHIPLDDAPELFTAAQDEAADAKRDVMRLLDALPKKQRDAIQLVKLDGVSVKDAAARLNLSESDVKVSAHRGLKTLMRLMADTES
ncbi:MAG: sigma-70 family RNA polymerase sigma factor [Hyphomonadaceae bacterium]|nr:sigma-70 family RNA polymerase sigma factor [Hyphomonadaceae bacterium]